MTEKRQYTRCPFEADLVVHGPKGEKLAARSQDISLGGMFVSATASFPFAAEIKLELVLPGLGKTELPGVVRWTKPDGFGVQFGLLGARQTHAIGAIVSGQS